MAESHLKAVTTDEPSESPDNRGGGDDDGTGNRLRHLEIQMGEVKTRLDYLPTKADLESVKTLISAREASMQRWLIGVVIAVMLAVLAAVFG